MKIIARYNTISGVMLPESLKYFTRLIYVRASQCEMGLIGEKFL